MHQLKDSRVLTSRSAARHIQDLVESGEYPPGSKLPSQRDLSSHLNVSRASLREALSALETMGLLNTEPGLGTFVARKEAQEGQPAWRFSARYSLRDVYQFRFVAEGYAARLAAMSMSDAQIGTLRSVLNEHREAIRAGDAIAGTEHDFEFHRLIMRFSANAVFVDLHASYRSILLESQLLPTHRIERVWEPIVEHENILRTLEKHDPDGASYFMHVHLAKAADRVGVVLNDVL